jgi:hypothetical protein
MARQHPIPFVMPFPVQNSVLWQKLGLPTSMLRRVYEIFLTIVIVIWFSVRGDFALLRLYNPTIFCWVKFYR